MKAAAVGAGALALLWLAWKAIGVGRAAEDAQAAREGVARGWAARLHLRRPGAAGYGGGEGGSGEGGSSGGTGDY